MNSWSANSTFALLISSSTTEFSSVVIRLTFFFEQFLLDVFLDLRFGARDWLYLVVLPGVLYQTVGAITTKIRSNLSLHLLWLRRVQINLSFSHGTICKSQRISATQARNNLYFMMHRVICLSPTSRTAFMKNVLFSRYVSLRNNLPQNLRMVFVNPLLLPKLGRQLPHKICQTRITLELHWMKYAPGLVYCLKVTFIRIGKMTEV